MEIEIAARPPAPTSWGRWAQVLVVLGPVALLTLLPIGLGLQRYVMTGDSMAGSISRGSIVFERVVPVSDLRVGDVVTYREPGTSETGAMVTRRIVSVEPEGFRTQADAVPAADPWLLRPEEPTMSRVEFAVPWIGWVCLVLLYPRSWLVTVVSAVALAVLVSRRPRRPSVTLRAADPADVAMASYPAGAGMSGSGMRSGTPGAKP
jgi:signal peptidase